jgi:alpha/beta superfamily hydrolase
VDIYSEKISFPSAAGEELAASLEQPSIEPLAYAVFAHCFTCSKDFIAASRITKSLASQGIAVLRFDFTGLGNSQGDFANTNFSSNVDDLIAAAGFLRANFRAPQLMVGHSLGGTAVIVAASRLPEIKALATVNSPYEPAHLKRVLRSAESEIIATGQAVVEIGGRPFTIKKQFLDDIAAHNMESILASLGRPLMIFHSPVDAIVDIENAVKIFQAARHPKSFISLDSADHLLTRKGDAELVGRTLAAWASRYILNDNSVSGT